MMDDRRLAYLEAMGIDVWRPRSARDEGSAASPGGALVQLGQGEGDILCIGPTRDASRRKLSVDISRAMRTVPVWSWPAAGPGSGADCLSLEAAVTERLLTQILVFGDALAANLFGAVVPHVIGTARVHIVPDLDSLDGDREAKRKLWNLMCEQGIAEQSTRESRKDRTAS